MVRDKEASLAAERALKAISPDVRKIADELGVSYSTVHSWRAGRRSPSPENLRKIASLADERADMLRGVAVEIRRIASEQSAE